MDIKLIFSLIVMIGAPLLIGYSIGFTPKQGIGLAITNWAFFTTMFSIGTLVAWFTGS